MTEMAETEINLLVCGGGNGAHALSTLASSRPNVRCSVLTLFSDEADRWTEILGGGYMTLNINKSEEEKRVVKSRPMKITHKPEEVVDSSNLIVITVPAFAHESYLEAIGPLLSPGCVVVGMPGHPGFEFQSVNILQKHTKEFTIMSFETLPWACRIDDFGKEITIHGVKSRVGCAVIRRGGETTLDPITSMQRIFGDAPIVNEFSSYLITNLNAKIHCPIVYGWWHDWDGEPLSKIPLIYKDIPHKAVNTLSDCGDELVAIAKKIHELKPEIDSSEAQHFTDYMLDSYKEYISDPTDLYSIFHTNKAISTMEQPMVKVGENQYVPNFKYRYYTEDTPFALAVVRGIAECVGIETPTIDKVLLWCQEAIGKEYLLGGKMKGKDVMETRAPQAYGIHNIDDLVNLRTS